ncbi:hypothetical protein V7182_23750 [Neobacillus drentensis]|uniref:hypothetical protein n=1 Tax=Neobacillus drentensis TaxID=220684 RepID=UPI002FFFD22C
MAKVKKPVITENEDLKKEFSYPEAMEFDTNRPLMIGVQGPYEFIVLDEKTYIISTRYKEKLMKGDKSKEDIKIQFALANPFYDPFEIFTIEQFINTVASINLNDADSILNFYNTYGPLGFDGMGTTQEAINSSVIRTFGMHLDTYNESLGFFKVRINGLKDALLLHEAIQNKDEKFLRSFTFDSAISREAIDESTPKEALLLFAKRQILHLINRNSHLINPVIGLTNGEITKFTTATCLLGVFYLRLYELVTENPKIKKCRYCGDYFIPRKTNANFCPPPEANEKSKCANRYDAMVRRIAEWHYKEGLSIEEIQNKLSKPKSRSIKEIQHILNNYKGKLKN